MTVGFSPGRLASRLVGRRPANVVLDGPAWNPGRLTTIRQRFLDELRTYQSSLIGGYPALTSEEPGTVAVPRAGRCFLFDGSDDYATLGAKITSGPITLLTGSAWIKRDSSGPMTVMCEWYSSNSWMLLCSASNKLGFLYSSDGADNISVASTATIPTSWTHVAFTYTASEIKLYINGELDSTHAVSDQIYESAVTRFQLGVASESFWFFDGSIRDARVYNVAKSADEVLAIKNQELHPDEVDHVGILAHWWCEDESGLKARDASGNGHDLTLMNTSGGTFQAVDSGVTYSAANECGHSRVASLQPSGSGSYDPDTTWIGGSMTGDFELLVVINELDTGQLAGFQQESVPASSGTYDYVDYGLQINSSTSVRVWFNGSNTDVTVSTLSVGSVLKLKREGTTYSLIQSGVTKHSMSGSSSAMYPVMTFTATLGPKMTLVLPTLDSYSTTHIGQYLTRRDLIIPRNESAPTLDVLGNTLQYAGPIKLPATTEVPCVTGDGSATYAELTGSRVTSGSITALTVTAWVYSPATAATCIASEWNDGSNQRSWLFHLDPTGSVNTPRLYYSPNGTDAPVTAVGSSFAADTWTHVAFTFSAGIVKFYINGVLDKTISTGEASLFNTSAPFRLGAYNSFGSPAFLLTGRISDERVFNVAKSDAAILAIKNGATDETGLLAQWPIQEGPGDDETNRTMYDVSGNGNDLTIVNGTVANIWANVCPRVRDHQIQYGGRLDTNNVCIPALLDESEAADGNTLNLTAGKRGNRGTLIAPNIFGAPSLVRLGLTTETRYAFGDAVQTVDPDDTKFRRTAASGDDRYFVSDTALVGVNLTNAEAYTA